LVGHLRLGDGERLHTGRFPTAAEASNELAITSALLIDEECMRPMRAQKKAHRRPDGFDQLSGLQLSLTAG
jgi:hypothetical protein